MNARQLVAVPMKDGHVGPHFGQSRAFTIFAIDQGALVGSVGEVLIADVSGCQVIAGVLAGEGVQTVLASGIGAGAVSALAHCGIKAVAGVRGRDPLELVRAFASGHLESTGKLCGNHHQHSEHRVCHGRSITAGD